jgi:cytidylate kinase
VNSHAFAIALDGPAASGKSTVGLGVAEQLGLRYFDSGLLYRALTWLALARGIDLADADRLTDLVSELQLEADALGHVWRDGTDLTPQLHTPEVDSNVSSVAAQPAVRTALIPVQRALARPPGLVMAGRDIGTVILPAAQLKIWLNAAAEVRAQRRARQSGEAFEDVLAGMRLRDHLDSSRSAAPMVRAADAVEVDTDGRSPEQVIEHIVQLARARQ